MNLPRPLPFFSLLIVVNWDGMKKKKSIRKLVTLTVMDIFKLNINSLYLV